MRKVWFLLFIWWDVFLCSVDMPTVHCCNFCRWLEPIIARFSCEGFVGSKWAPGSVKKASKVTHAKTKMSRNFCAKCDLGFFTVANGIPWISYQFNETAAPPIRPWDDEPGAMPRSRQVYWLREKHSILYLLSRKPGDCTLETLQDDVSAFTATLMACERARQRVQSALVLEDMRRASVLGDDWQFCDLPYFDSSPCTP